MHATKANLPSQLPFLPGNSYADPTITRYHKTQLLNVRDGAMLGKSEVSSVDCEWLSLNLQSDPNGQLTLYLSINHFGDVEKTTTLQEDIDQELLRSMKEGDPLKLTGIPPRKAHENDAIPKIAPKWLKHDKQVREVCQTACTRTPSPFRILFRNI